MFGYVRSGNHLTWVFWVGGADDPHEPPSASYGVTLECLGLSRGQMSSPTAIQAR